MSAINSKPSDLEYKLQKFEELTKSVKDAGISLEPGNAPESLYDALGFLIEATQEVYAEKWKFFIEDFIKNIHETISSSGNRAACEVSWKFDRKIESLLQAKLTMMATKDVNHDRMLGSILKLYQAVNRSNAEEHAKGEPVHFGGVPGYLVPGWCRKSNVEQKGKGLD